MTKTNQPRTQKLVAVALGLICLFGSVGCGEGWVSRNEPQGANLEQVFENGRFPVTAPEHWPLEFDGIDIEKRTSKEKGTEYRAKLTVKQPENDDEFQKRLQQMLNVESPKHGNFEGQAIVTLNAFVRYYDSEDRMLGMDSLPIHIGMREHTFHLSGFGERGVPTRCQFMLDGPFPATTSTRNAQ